MQILFTNSNELSLQFLKVMLFLFLALKLFLALFLLFSTDSVSFKTLLFGLLPFSFLLFFALFLLRIDHFIKRNLMDKIFVLAHFGELFTAAETAAKWEC